MRVCCVCLVCAHRSAGRAWSLRARWRVSLCGVGPHTLVFASQVKDPNCVFLFGFKTQFGGGKSTGFAIIYDSIEDALDTEPRYRLVRVRVAAARARVCVHGAQQRAPATERAVAGRRADLFRLAWQSSVACWRGAGGMACCVLAPLSFSPAH